jgi:hypothetical protein
MAWIRLSDDYNDHPKFAKLSDGAFRLWHQGMGFCRKFQTDGLIPTSTVREFKAYGPKRMRELMTPWRDAENPLWHHVDGFGVKVHDYLQWNPSKEAENQRRNESKERMRVARSVRANNLQTTHKVPGLGRELGSSSEKGSGEKPLVRGAIRISDDPDTEIAARAGLLLERYGELFYQHRRGARYHGKPALDFQKACDLVTTWPDDARLEKLAVLVLTTDDDWISRTDRGFGIFVAKASWADGKLAEWEAANGLQVTT